MTHPSVNMALRVALAFMALRLVLFFANLDFPYLEQVFLFLLLAAFPGLSIYAVWPRQSSTSFQKDFVNSLRLTAVFSVAMALFIFSFYAFADTNYFPNTRDLIVSRELAANPDLNEEELRKNVAEFFSIRNFSVLATLFFLLMAAFYSIVFSALKRLVIK
jgi:hypothetical protein